MASTTLVDELLLKTESHPWPYSIEWLKQGKELKVSTWRLISFSIGKDYMDQLWCDIISMDACYVLLGRPWLYDWKVTHDGFLNTYTLHKNGRKITLVPLPPHQIANPKSVEPPKDGGVLLSFLKLTLKAEQREFKAPKELILHVRSQDPQTKTPSHPLAKQLLQEFSPVFLEDMPHSLPLKTTLQHHIDLIPGAIYPTSPLTEWTPKTQWRFKDK